jgi:hypothetical protein
MLVFGSAETVIVFHVPEADISRVALKQTIPFKVDSFPFKTFEANVSSIAPAATVVNKVKGFEVKALINQSTNQILHPGMTGDFDLPAVKK